MSKCKSNKPTRDGSALSESTKKAGKRDVDRISLSAHNVNGPMGQRLNHKDFFPWAGKAVSPSKSSLKSALSWVPSLDAKRTYDAQKIASEKSQVA